MEGLIPMLYKSFKKNKTRRRYECLSSGAAQTYNIADFYVKDDNDYIHDYLSRNEYLTPDPEMVSRRRPHHRRYNSVADLDHRRAGAFALEGDAAKPKKLLRFRSHRMFSCVTSGA